MARSPDRSCDAKILETGCRSQKQNKTQAHIIYYIVSNSDRHPVFSGPNHPRNYAAMHASFNGSFADKCPEIKMAYLEEHSSSALRQVHMFLTELRESSLSVTAEDYFYSHLMLP